MWELPEEEFFEEIKLQHDGKGVEVKDRQVVAVSHSYHQVYRELKEKKFDGVYVFYCPSQKERRYGFLFR